MSTPIDLPTTIHFSLEELMLSALLANASVRDSPDVVVAKAIQATCDYLYAQESVLSSRGDAVGAEVLRTLRLKTIAESELLERHVKASDRNIVS